MRIDRHDDRERLELKSSPGESSTLKGCGAGCIVAWLLPLLVIAVALLIGNRSVAGLISIWSELFLVAISVAIVLFARPDFAEIDITPEGVSGCREGRSRRQLWSHDAAVTMQVHLRQREPNPRGAVELRFYDAATRKERQAIRFQVDGIDRYNFVGLASSIAQILGYAYVTEGAAGFEERTDTAVVFTYSNDALDEEVSHRKIDEPIRMSAHEREEWSAPSLSEEEKARLGIEDSTPGVLLLGSRAWNPRLGVIALAVFVACAASLYQMARDGEGPWSPSLRTFLLALGAWFSGAAAMALGIPRNRGKMRIDTGDGQLTLKCGRRELRQPLDTVRSIVLGATGDLYLDTTEGILRVPGSGFGERDQFRVARMIADLLRCRCQIAHAIGSGPS